MNNWTALLMLIKGKNLMICSFRNAAAVYDRSLAALLSEAPQDMRGSGNMWFLCMCVKHRGREGERERALQIIMCLISDDFPL